MTNTEHPHRRFNPLLQKWVLVSPHRTKRPWQGEQVPPSAQTLPSYDPTCYLCPGNTRAHGEVNPDYRDAFSFVNDFSALVDSPEGNSTEALPSHPLLRAESARGICKVICFSPRHNLTVAEMSQSEIVAIINTWRSETEEISSRPEISYITIFENKGPIMGCSNPHPHGQIWASDCIPSTPLRSFTSQRDYFRQTGKNLLHEYISLEVASQERVVFENDAWACVVPFWAEWPYEVMIAPKHATPSLRALDQRQIALWAEAIQHVTAKFDNLFTTSFPYSMGIYQEPCDGQRWEGASMYQVFLPPLLRSASVRKYMVGFEMISEAQRDVTPELAARTLRALPNEHYTRTR